MDQVVIVLDGSQPFAVNRFFILLGYCLLFQGRDGDDLVMNKGTYRC